VVFSQLFGYCALSPQKACLLRQCADFRAGIPMMKRKFAAILDSFQEFAVKSEAIPTKKYVC
jgi:hypothetical protein